MQYLIILIPVVLFALGIIGSVCGHKPSDKTPPDCTGANRVSGSFGSLGSVTRYYDGDTRFIDGRPIKTINDWDEWQVIKWFSVSIGDHLREIERRMEQGECDNYAATKREWDEYYAKLRALCIRHQLWNPALEDRTPFIPTPSQLRLEESLKSRIEESCEIGIDCEYDYHVMKESILNYIAAQPGHAAIRKKLVNQLSNGFAPTNKAYQSACRKMVRDGILSESHNDHGDLVLRKKRASHKKEEPLCIKTKSAFDKAKYSNIPYTTLCKVKHTVGIPINVDKDNMCCEFVSLSNGEKYHTSLSDCTCPAFYGDKPCKHMIAYAKFLGYI